MATPILGDGALAYRLRKQRSTAVAGVILFLACVGVGLLQGEQPFYFDSGYYWGLSKTFVENGHFSLFNFQYTGLRGYCIPLLYFVWRNATEWMVGNESSQVLLLNSAIFALIGAVLIPRLATIAWPESRWGLGRRVAAGGLILFFWRGFLNYPLSDFPALAAALLAIVAVSYRRPSAVLFAGMAAAFASNARPANLLLAPLLLGIVIWDQLEGQSFRLALRPRVLVAPALFLVGIALVSVPQSVLQHRDLGGYSPLPGGSELAQLQYTVGLELDLYGTYVGKPRRAVLDYRDPDTASVFAKLDNGQVSGTSEYVDLIVKHPLTMAQLFIRHFLDGLDYRFTTPYTYHLQPPLHHFVRAAGFLLVFLAILRFAWAEARRSLGRARWRYPAVLLLLGLTALPTAMEQRFLLPIFALSVMLCLAPGWPNPFRRDGAGLVRWRTPLTIGIGALAFFAVVAITVHSASENLVVQPLAEPGEALPPASPPTRR